MALIERHEAGARVVSHYDFNNTYQYVIAREETHLTWLQDALAEFGAALPRASARAAGAGRRQDGEEGRARARSRPSCEDDVRTLGAFVDEVARRRWTP